MLFLIMQCKGTANNRELCIFYAFLIANFTRFQKKDLLLPLNLYKNSNEEA